MSLFIIIFLAISPSVYGKVGGGRVGSGRGGWSSHYPSTGNSYHPPKYPQSHNYPSTSGLSGNQRTYSSNYHTHYHYAPPQHINYGATHHPVYQGTPPVYVYQYKESGSKFDNLLTGLALYNLGRMSANNNNYDYHHGYRYDPNREYRGSAGEMCKFVIYKKNGEYEETRIDCKLMSSFIWDEERERDKQKAMGIEKSVTVIQTKDGNSTVTFQNTTIIDAREVKGPSIHVTKDMNCFMVRLSADSSTLKRKVDCGLLQEYAVSSLRYRNSCGRVLPVIMIFLSIMFLKGLI